MIVKNAFRRVPARVLVIGLCILTAGCKEVLYSDLSEVDANEMATVLEAAGISASRSRDKNGVYSVLVDGSAVAVANTILNGQGLPRKRFKTMDEIFAADGLVGSPFEEQVRYTFALEEKLTSNLVSIDGIRDARVTINLPQKSRFGEQLNPATASVILHHEEDFVVEDSVAKIKTLISHSVQGLDYADVAIVVFPAGGPAVSATSPEPMLVGAAKAATRATDEALTLQMPRSNNLIAVIAVFCLGALVLLFAMVRRLMQRLGWSWGR